MQGKEVRAHQRQIAGRFAVEIVRQMHAIISLLALLAVNHDVIVLMQFAGNQLFKKVVTDHAVTNHG